MKKNIIAVVLAFIIIFSSVTTLAETQGEGVVIYVSPNGSDLNQGTFEKPLQTLEAAKEKIAKYSNNQPLTVVFRGGTYNVYEAVEFTTKDSGSEKFPVVYKSYEGEQAVFTSANKLDVSLFEHVKDETVLAKIPSEARPYVLKMDLTKAGITVPEKAWAESTGTYLENWISLYLDEKTQMLAQWPNGEMNYDTYSKPELSGPTGEKNPGGGAISVTTPRILNWANTDTDQTFLTGYWGADYRKEVNMLEKADTEKMWLYLKYGTNAGVKSIGTRRYKILNLIEELDIPSEYFVDRKTNTLYYYPPYDLTDKNLYLSCNNNFEIINVNGADNVIFENLKFYGVYRGFSLANSKNIKIQGCTFFGTTDNAIYFATETKRLGGQYYIGIGLQTLVSGCENIVIDSCDFYDGGTTFITIEVGDSARLIKGNSYITNCFFERSDLIKSAATIFSRYACGFTFKNNTIHNAALHAFNWGGNYITIHNNEIYNVTREPYDAGAVYSYNDFAKRGSDIAYNIIHDTDSKGTRTSHGTRGLYSDGELSGNFMHHNILWQTGAGIHHNAGVTNDISNNIIMDVRNGAMEFAYLDYTSNHATRAEKISQLLEIAPWWGEEFPELYRELEYAKNLEKGSPLTTMNYNITDSKWNWSENALPTLKEFNGNTQIDPTKDTSMFVDYENRDYRLKAGTEFAKQFPDALTDENFSYSDVGVQITEHRKTLPYFNQETSPFVKLYPINGQTGIYPDEVTLSWEIARGADRYTVTVAKDPEMKQIVETQVCDNAYAIITDLNKNTTYYWTVEAENYSAITPSKWNNTDEVYSFITGAYESIDTTMLRYYTERLKREANKMKEAKEPGCFPEGSKQELLDAVEEAEIFFSYTEAQTTQKEIDNQIEHLKEVYTSIATSMYIKDINIDELMPNNMTWYGVGRITQGTGNPMNFEYDEKTGIFKIESTINQHTAITKDELSDGVIRHYKMRVNYNGTGGWFGIAEKGQLELEKDQYFPKDQQNIFNYGYAVPAYMMLINATNVEFHNRSNKNNLVIDSMANSYIKDGEWFDLDMGVVTTLSGDQFIVRINGKEIYNKSVDTATIMKPGKMYIFFSKKGMSIEIKKDENFTEGEVYSMMDKKDVSGIAGTENEIISIGDILSEDKWTADNTTAEFGADFIKTEATGTEFSSLIYSEKKVYNALANLDTVLKLENDNAFAVSLRASEPESPYNTKSNDNYYFSLKDGYVDVVHRSSTEQLLARIPNNGIYTNGERTNIQAGVVDCDGGVRVVLYVNGTCMLDVIDANASFTSGSLVLYDRMGVGMEIYAPSMSAITLEDIPNEAYVEKGIIATQQAAKKSSGSWSETQKAVNGVALAQNKQEDGAPATLNYEISAPGTVYHVYYWSGITYVGDENVKVTISSHYDGNDRVFNINNKFGKTGWIYLGAYATSDFYIRAMVEGSGNGTLLSGGFKLIPATDTDKLFTRLMYANKGAVVLNTGSKKAFVDGQPTLISAEPVVTNGRTLVPIRFISEAFGANVKWDNATSSAIVKADGHTLVFKLNSNTYTKDGVERYLDQPATTVNGRMMLPIRVVSEDLGKNVYWEETNSGLIIINDKEVVVEGLAENIQAAINYYLQ